MKLKEILTEMSAFAIAKKVGCPLCGAKPNCPCTGVKGSKNEGKTLNTLHNERLRAAGFGAAKGFLAKSKIKEMTDHNANHYEWCMVWQNEEDAAEIKDVCNSKYGTEVQVDWNVMYFTDKFEYDYVDYHYVMKIPPQRRPEKKLVSELTPEDSHKTA